MITPALVLPDGWSLFWQSSSIKALHHGGQLSLSRIPPPDQFAIVPNLRTQDHFLASLCNLCTGSLNFVSGNCSNFWKAWKDVRSKWEKHSLHWGHLQTDQMSPVLIVNVCFCQCERERWEAYAAKASSTTTAPPPIPVHLLCVMLAVVAVNELKPVAGGGIRYPVSLPPTARLLTSLFWKSLLTGNQQWKSHQWLCLWSFWWIAPWRSQKEIPEKDDPQRRGVISEFYETGRSETRINSHAYCIWPDVKIRVMEKWGKYYEHPGFCKHHDASSLLCT